MRITDRKGNTLSSDDVLPALGSDGIAFLSATGFEDLAASLPPLLSTYPHPHATVAGWTVIRDRCEEAFMSPGMEGFTSSGLLPHTDRSFLPRPPPILLFMLLTGASSGGEVSLFDSSLVMRRRTFGDLSGLQDDLWLADISGQDRQRMLSVRSGLCIQRYRNDSVGFPRARSAAGRMLLQELERATTSPMRITLRPGEGYMIHNHRFLHGRSAFNGNRLGARLLAFVDKASPYAWLNNGFRLCAADRQQGSL